MSSQFGGIGGGISGGTGGIRGGLAGALESFARRRPVRDPFEGMEEWELLQAAGASKDLVEAERLKASVYGPGGTLETSEILGIEQDENEKKGILSGVTDFLTRGGSATVGFLSGLAGLERERRTEDGGELIPEANQTVEGGLGLAFERFMDGLTGEEQFRSADFGVLAYDRETAPTWERVAKSAAGFVLDVALDPITYMSMGGSIFGRVKGAQRVWGAARTKNRANVMDLVDTKNPDQILDIVKTTPEYFGATTSKIAAEIGESLKARGIKVPAKLTSFTMDKVVDILRANPEVARDVAGDMIAANMAVAYRGGSSYGLMGYLKANFGDAGMQAYRALPMDLQGGIRMRVPFSALGGKDPKVLFRIPGTEKLSALTDGARDVFRNTIPGFRSLSADAAGKMGLSDKRLASAYYRSVHDTTRKVYGEWIPETGTIGWLDVKDARNVFADADNALTKFTYDITSLYKSAAIHISKGRKAAEESGENFNEIFYQGALVKRVSGRLGDDGSVKPNLMPTDVFGGNPTIAQREAYDAAVHLQTINTMVLERAQQIWNGDNGRMFKAIGPEGQYWPRMVKDMNDTLKGAKSGVKGKKPDVLFERQRFFSFLDDDGNVGNWFNNLEVQKRFGDIFEVDPERVMYAYMKSVVRAMREEQITKNLLNKGLAFEGTQITELNEAVVSRVGAEVLRKMEARKLRAEQINYVTNRVEAKQVYEALAGWRNVGPRVYTHYRDIPAPEGGGLSQVFQSIDGTRIEKVGDGLGNFRVRRADGKYLNAEGKWSEAENAARAFARRTDAESTANTVMYDSRNMDYQDRAQELLDEFRAVSADELSSLEILNPAWPENWPSGTVDQQEHMVAIVNIIKDFGESRPQSFYSRPIVGQQYKELTERSGLAALAETTALDNNVRGQLASRWDDLKLLTPAALVDDVQRLGSAGSKLSPYIKDFYLPFYAMQKSLMTSQRGPGYVVRNVIGGMWNAYLLGVGSKHWKGAAVALRARNEAFDWAKKQWPDGDVRQADAGLKKFREILEERLGTAPGKEMFDYYESFDAMQLGGRSIRSRTLGTRSDELFDNIPEDISLAIQEGDVSKWSYRSMTDYVGSRNRWAQFMTRQATESEDFLRFGSFLRGIDDFGFGDGGQLASMYTLASQFDYTDLSKFEREKLKLIMPFYTWARNNIPLQFRALMSEPGKVLKAVRINEALKDAFGEPGEEEPLPVWIRQNMGWQIRSDLITGPMGDPLALGLVVGEPLQDLNNIFGAPQEGIKNIVNWREAINSLNPAFATAVTAFTGIEQATGGRLPRTEPAPPWAEPLVRAGYMGTLTPDGDTVVSARTLRVIRDTLAPFGSVERLAPQFFGNERYQRRVLSSWASTLFGVPLRTLDPFQTGSELRTRQNRMDAELKRNLGENVSLYTGWVSRLVDMGATAADMAIVKETVLGLAPNQNISSLPAERMDYTAAKETVEMLRRVERLQEIGVSETVIRSMWENFEPRTDKEVGAGFYSLARQSVPPEVLETLGLSVQDVEMMSREELLAFLERVAGR
jgi:hypothetical protein